MNTTNMVVTLPSFLLMTSTIQKFVVVLEDTNMDMLFIVT